MRVFPTNLYAKFSKHKKLDLYYNFILSADYPIENENVCIGNPIENETSWFPNTSFSIGFPIQIIRRKNKIST